MAKYRKKYIVVEATQWFKAGDHPRVEEYSLYTYSCSRCGKMMKDHGWIKKQPWGRKVCPGDWIVTEAQGWPFPCKPDVFASKYDKIEDEK